MVSLFFAALYLHVVHPILGGYFDQAVILALHPAVFLYMIDNGGEDHFEQLENSQSDTQ